jgi:deazaflavin-dependent oxidoreductase (nitroreductase family)
VPPFLNAMVKVFLKTPVLQTALGRQLALLSFTGRRSGKLYTIPISYERRDGSVLMLTKRTRSWWRNFESQPAVELRLAGKTVKGTAQAHVATDADLDTIVDFLASRPVDAKAYGVVQLPDGSPDPESVRTLLPRNVLIRVTLD